MAPHVAQLPPKWNERLRASLRAILMAEAVAMRELRQALRAATVDVRAQLLGEDVDENEAIPALMESDHRLYLALLALLLLLRANARKDATKQFKAEAALAGISLAHIFVTIRDRTDEDQARAESIARNFCAAWLLAVMAAYRRDIKDPVGATNEALDYRLRRIAGTEIPHAYGRGHDEWLAILAVELGPEAALWAKRWDATLDMKTCRICRRMHGEVQPLGAAFTGGLLPGDVHPFCRCVPTLIPIPAVLEAAA